MIVYNAFWKRKKYYYIFLGTPSQQTLQIKTKETTRFRDWRMSVIGEIPLIFFIFQKAVDIWVTLNTAILYWFLIVLLLLNDYAFVNVREHSEVLFNKII